MQNILWDSFVSDFELHQRQIRNDKIPDVYNNNVSESYF